MSVENRRADISGPVGDWLDLDSAEEAVAFEIGVP
jgi:hypothetical protein